MSKRRIVYRDFTSIHGGSYYQGQELTQGQINNIGGGELAENTFDPEPEY